MHLFHGKFWFPFFVQTTKLKTRFEFYQTKTITACTSRLYISGAITSGFSQYHSLILAFLCVIFFSLSCKSRNSLVKSEFVHEEYFLDFYFHWIKFDVFGGIFNQNQNNIIPVQAVNSLPNFLENILNFFPMCMLQEWLIDTQSKKKSLFGITPFCRIRYWPPEPWHFLL